jgi:outer membrane protein OmpA-like peptidoglycan-associated protein
VRKPIVASVVCLLTIGLAAGVWMLVVTFRELKAGLRMEKNRSAALSRELMERSRALDQSRSEANEARTQSELASRDAEKRSAAAEAADYEKRKAEQARIVAEQASREALNRENLARAELAELRLRREQELNRMQQALSKIAPTRRTASGMVVELANDSFHFDFDKSTLRPENRELLSRIAGVLLASDGYRLFVYGHTDDIGPEEYNQQLSLRRANSVADYLKHAGVLDEVMNVQGFGKSSPRMNNDTAEARQKNRRVEIGIVDSIIEYERLAPDA